MKKKKCLIISDSYSINELTLRKCLLAFDEVRVLDYRKHLHLIPFGTITDTFRFPDGQSMTTSQADYGALIKLKGEQEEFDQFLEKNNWAIKKAALVITDPNPVLRKHARILRMTYDIDLSNTPLMNFAAAGIQTKFCKNGQLEGLESSGGIFQGFAIAPSGMTSLWATLPKPTDLPFENIKDTDLRQSVTLLSWTRVTKLLTALSLAVEYDSIPVTDINALNSMIIQKYKWLTEDADSEILEVLGKLDYKRNHLFSLLQNALIADIFTDDELLQIPIRQLIAYRQASQNELHKFRSKLSKLIDLITKEIWDPKLELEIARIIEKEVIPDIYEYIDKKKELKDQIIGTLIKSTGEALETTATLALPLSVVKNTIEGVFSQGNIMPNVSLIELTFFAGLFAAKYLKESVKGIVDAKIKGKAEERRNALTYFMRLKA